jgi:hypothetical protein
VLVLRRIPRFDAHQESRKAHTSPPRRSLHMGLRSQEFLVGCSEMAAARHRAAVLRPDRAASARTSRHKGRATQLGSEPPAELQGLSLAAALNVALSASHKV